MSEHEGETQIMTPDQPDTLLDQLAAKAKDVAETRDTMIPLPGYDIDPPLLLVKYRLLEGKELEDLGRRIRKERQVGTWDKQINAMVDMMVAACVGLFVDLGDGIRKPLTVGGQEVLGFTVRLAEGLQFADQLEQPPTQRAVVIKLFGDNDLAIAEHVARLNRWFTNTTVNVSEALFGGNL